MADAMASWGETETTQWARGTTAFLAVEQFADALYPAGIEQRLRDWAYTYPETVLYLLGQAFVPSGKTTEWRAMDTDTRAAVSAVTSIRGAQLEAASKQRTPEQLAEDKALAEQRVREWLARNPGGYASTIGWGDIRRQIDEATAGNPLARAALFIAAGLAFVLIIKWLVTR